MENEFYTRGRKFRFHYRVDSRILLVTILTYAHEKLHLELYTNCLTQIYQMGLFKSWDTKGGTAYLSQGEYPGRDKGEGDSSGGPKVNGRGTADWPTLVIEGGYSPSINMLRAKMRWWFATSDHDVKIVVLAKFDQRLQKLTLEKWEEEVVSRQGATTTRSMTSSGLQPVQQQTITVTENPNTDPISYNVARGALVLEFRLLFRRDPGPGEGDVVFGIPLLEYYASEVWAAWRAGE